ncbi:MAG: S41 family peptidase [Spirochaetota bacterium]
MYRLYTILIFSLFLCVSLVMISLSGCANDEFGGLGIEVPSGQGKVTSQSPYVIVSVFEGGTGYEAGLKPGDIIISVDGIALKGLQYDYIVQNLLKGKVGSMVTLEIERNGEKLLFRIPRGKVVLKD